MTVQHTDQSLFQLTAKDLAIPEDVLKKRYGIYPDHQVYISPQDRQKLIAANNGTMPDISGLRIHYTDPTGRPYTYLKASTKTETEGADRQQYVRKRNNPKLLASGLRSSKYYTPKGADPKLYFNASTGAGKTLIIVEGEKKAAYLNYHFGIRVIGTSGITLPIIDQDSERYIISEGITKIIILYDSDMTDLSYSKELDTAGMPCTSRSMQFAAAASKSIEQIYALSAKHGLKIQTYIAQVNPRTGIKGIDENKPADIKADIIQALKDFKSNDTLLITKASKSNYKEKIKGILGLNSHEDFWHKHSEAIQDKPFLFFGAQYRKKAYHKGFFELLNDPHQQIIEKKQIRIKKYLSEKAQDIVDSLGDHVTVIDAETGTGKTTFAKTLQGKKILALPYKGLTEQVALAAGKKALVSGVTRYDIAEAAKDDLIICVYDMLPALKEVIKDSTLIMDEAHNLTKAYQYRSQILTYIYSLITEKVAKKTILLSGTPDHLLSKVLQAKVIEVRRSDSNIIKVHPVQARCDSAKAYIEKALDCCLLLDRSKVNFAFYNDIDSLELIKKTLIDKHGWIAEDIAIISRPHIMANDFEYMQLIEKEVIKGRSLILSTVLIAEGVNIKNTDIGAAITIKQFCPKMFLQFVARFRSMPELPVYDIKAPELILMPDFFKTPTQRYLEERTAAQARLEEIEQKEKSIFEGLAPEDQAFYSFVQSERKSTRKALTIKHLTSNEGRYKIDDLSIIHQIDQDIINEGNNAYFYTQIARQAGIIIDLPVEPEAVNEAHIIEDVKTQLAEDKEAQQAQLIDDLKRYPSLVVTALFIRYDKAGDRKGTAFINDHCAELVELSDEAYQYYVNHRGFSSKC